LHQRTLRVEGESVEARRRRCGYLVKRRDVSRYWREVLGGAVCDLCWREGELGVVGLVGLPLLESRNDADDSRLVGADKEMERASGRDRAE
jgi:hypothetical protein